MGLKKGDRVRLTQVLPDGRLMYPSRPLGTVLEMQDIFGPVARVALDEPTFAYDGHPVHSVVLSGAENFTKVD